MSRFTEIFNPLALLRTFNHSFRGLAHAARHERAFQQEIAILAVGAVAAFLLTGGQTA